VVEKTKKEAIKQLKFNLIEIEFILKYPGFVSK